MTRRRRSPLPPYFKWRDGRPRWEPGPGLRARGVKGCDLKDEQGRWLDIGAAIAAARKRNADLAAGVGAAATPPARRTTKPARTCRSLYELWASPAEPGRASPRWQHLAPITQRDYRSKAGIFLDEFGDDRVEALSKGALHNWWEELYRDRGHAMANGTLAVVRAMLSYGVMKGWIDINPAKALGLVRVAPRVMVWTPQEIEHMVAVADNAGQHGVADAIVIALHTGQRQGDTLALEDQGTANRRSNFKQGKTGARVSVPFTPQLAERLKKIRARRRAGAIAEMRLTGPLVRDAKGRKYTRETFGVDFRAVRALAIEEMPALGEKLFLDLRDTAITRLALAGCTVAEIRAITGHSLETIHQVLKHYLALDDRMADAAIGRLKDWMEKEGIAI